ncbi:MULTISPECIES: tol-pal system YbgF family protein [unclassified Lentimicrobium]|uniref:tetratricopeptide repeat protein n=1 Tax=unclassified Lentimicrobium TaxID=2677434 RepID=UPI0015524E18|nr:MULTISPECIES: tetratricopeptide repeat protein [unclassified Lentimicrobium]NPD48045.1 tetratricopeptide repeat protein [Lentimicrobium sp. S6]NPD86886.1 tetratricopeptide repeat protein [Lentimicrobium sp. L6]
MAQQKNTKDLTEERFEAVEEALTRSEQIIEKHQKTILTVIGIIVVIVVAYFGFDKYYLQPLEEDAQIEIASAETYFAQDSLNLALNGDGAHLGFLDIISDYGMTKSANLSHYYAGVCYLKLGQYEDAITYLKGFSANDQVVAPMAMGAIGDAYMELGDTDKAINYYLDAANQKINEFTSPVFLQKAALAYESKGDFAKALGLHERIKQEFSKTTEGRQADKYIAYLKGKQNK